MSALAKITMLLLWGLLLVSAIGVVWSRHETRSLFIELQSLSTERDALDI